MYEGVVFRVRLDHRRWPRHNAIASALQQEDRSFRARKMRCADDENGIAIRIRRGQDERNGPIEPVAPEAGIANGLLPGSPIFKWTA